MNVFISTILLAFAVSLDSFGVGVTYGLRRIRVPFISLMVISICSGIVVLVSMQLGSYFVLFLTEQIARMIGAGILIIIGIWTIYNISRTEEAEENQSSTITKSDTVYNQMEPQQLYSLEIKTFGLVITILRKPSEADVDRSGSISPGEAILLGTALSFDALGAGFAAAMINFQPWVVAGMIALMAFLFLLSGIQFGLKCARFTWMRGFSYLPGIILIFFGLLKLL